MLRSENAPIARARVLRKKEDVKPNDLPINTSFLDSKPCAILVVEDSLPVRLRVIEHLAGALPDVRIEGVECLEDAVEHLASIGMPHPTEQYLSRRGNRFPDLAIQLPDVLVLDLELPGFSGLNLLRAIKRDNPQIGVVVFTCLNSTAVRRACLSLGADFFVHKGEDIAKLEVAVHALIARRRARMDTDVPPAATSPLEQK
jgi:CheY-like chemotaxis protein